MDGLFAVEFEGGGAGRPAERPAAPPHSAYADPEIVAQRVTQVDASDEDSGVSHGHRHRADERPALLQTPPGKRSASAAVLQQLPLRTMQERLATYPYRPQQAASSPASGPASSPRGSHASPAAKNVAAAEGRLAATDASFNRSWQAWQAALQQRTGKFLDPEFSERIKQLPLWREQKIVAKVSSPSVEKPVGFLVGLLRDAEGQPPKPNEQQSPRSNAGRQAAAAPGAVALGAFLASAQPPEDPFRASLPLAIVDCGEAGNLAPEAVHCESCALQISYRRRAVRASGVAQPLSLHRFARCGCGCYMSVIMREHFPNTYLISFLMTRKQSTMSAQPSMTPTQLPTQAAAAEGAPASEPAEVSVARYLVEDARCAGCSSRLQLIVYDPIDHVHHSIEYGCPRCQEVYAGTCASSGHRVLATLMRTRPRPEDAAA